MKCDRIPGAGVYSRSPSIRREWIEMLHLHQLPHLFRKSPSIRREWIEMHNVRN